MTIIEQYDMLNTAIEDSGYNTLLAQTLMDLTNKVLNKQININDKSFVNAVKEDFECYTDYNGYNTDIPCVNCSLNKLCQYKGNDNEI